MFNALKWQLCEEYSYTDGADVEIEDYLQSLQAGFFEENIEALGN